MKKLLSMALLCATIALASCQKDDDPAPAPTPATIGDFYYSDNTHSSTFDSQKSCVGVVFWIDPNDNTKGKIVSLDETEAKWSTEEVLTGASSETDGAANTDKILAVSSYTAEKYPAAAWCVAKNASAGNSIKWYFPAKLELQDQLYPNVVAINTSLTSAGGKAIALTYRSHYYSSSEYNDEKYSGDISVWYFGFYADKINPMHNAKNMTGCTVRAIAAF